MLWFYEKLPFSLKSDFFYEIEVVVYLSKKRPAWKEKKQKSQTSNEKRVLDISVGYLAF